MKRVDILQEVAKQVPEKHKVNLEQPEVFILIEIFKVLFLAWSIMNNVSSSSFDVEYLRDQHRQGLLPDAKIQCDGDCEFQK